MKIEKLNDNQIRCTLTRQDLVERELKLSELAYGSEKAKALFREMMQQAAFEHGFEANDIPLMIEAIPLSMDTLVLIITKVDEPDELDTRFASFTPDSQPQDNAGSFTSLKLEGADDILNLFQKIRDTQKNLAQKAKDTVSDTREKNQPEVPIDLEKMYGFERLDDIIHVAQVLQESYNGDNALYKDPSTGEYRLILHKSQHTPEQFNRICNTISEYGWPCKYSAGSLAFLAEHGEVIIPSAALQNLAAKMV